MAPSSARPAIVRDARRAGYAAGGMAPHVAGGARSRSADRGPDPAANHGMPSGSVADAAPNPPPDPVSVVMAVPRPRKPQAPPAGGPPPRGRSERQRLGDDAEEAACRYLRRQGLRILARQVGFRRGEIDIVARDGEELVFVEVRSRGAGGLAAASVDAGKRARLRRAAQLYLLREHGDRWPACRFDVVLQEEGTIRWLRAAFGAEEESR